MQQLLEFLVFAVYKCVVFSVHLNNMLGSCHFSEYFAFDMSSKIEDGKTDQNLKPSQFFRYI